MRLKRRPTLADKNDDYLLLTVEEAVEFFLDYTHRVKDPGAQIDNLICEMAVLRINAEGAENVQAATIGDISTTWYSTIPPMIVPRLNRWRLMVGLNAEYGI